jgi:pyruvate ferredoxin oxidoreductase alpha subunit
MKQTLNKSKVNMGKIVAITGTSAMANAMRQINPDVVAAYPITPQTAIVEEFSSYAANGKVKTGMITVESEHSAMSACIGASAAGARVMTATSSAGLALMWEMLYVASGVRTPIIMPMVNRALSAPINIHCDHSDSMGARDAGWIQLYSENAQEAYDNLIQAVRIGEHLDVRLPVMVMMDGFITSHAIDRLEILSDEVVRNFVGDFKALYPLLDVEHPVTHGPFDLYDYNFEHKRGQAEGVRKAKQVIIDVASEFEKISGRKYELFKTYKMDDAEIAVIVLSSTAGTAKTTVDKLRNEGIKAGLIAPRVFRPFPAKELAEAINGLKAVAVMDRSDSFNGIGGPVFTEVTSAACTHLKCAPIITDYVYGIGGRDCGPDQIEIVYRDLVEDAKNGKPKELVHYLGIRE